MTTMIRIFLVLAAVSSIARADRDEPPQGKMSMFKEGTQLYNYDFIELRRDLQRKCVGDPAEKWLDRLSALDAKVAKLAKPEDRKQFQEFLVTFRTWLTDRSTNVPGVGTWDDARKAVAAMRALATVAPPPAGTSDAEVRAMIDYAVSVRATQSASDKSISYAQNKLVGCEEFLGKSQELGNVRKTLDANMRSIEAGLSEAARTMAKEQLEPFRGAMVTLDEKKDVTTWDGHVKYVAAAFAVLATAKDLVANEARYLALGPYGALQYGPDQAIPDAKRLVAELGPKIGAMVEEVSFPKGLGKDAARDKIVKASLEGKTVLNGPAQLPGVSKDTFTENEGGVSYPAKRETASAYYVLKPAAWKGPVPDGINADDLCEMHWAYLMRWTAGPPSRKARLNQWHVETDRMLAPILCKNAKRISKLK